MKLYITKYALTKGVLEVNGKVDDNGYAIVSINNSKEVFNRKDWYLNKNNAIERAEELKTNKIKSLENKYKN